MASVRTRTLLQLAASLLKDENDKSARVLVLRQSKKRRIVVPAGAS